MDGIYAFDHEGNFALTPEALQWLRDGKLRAIYRPVMDPEGSPMVVDQMFMGYEPCDPEVARILSERMYQELSRSNGKSVRPHIVEVK